MSPFIGVETLLLSIHKYLDKHMLCAEYYMETTSEEENYLQRKNIEEGWSRTAGIFDHKDRNLSGFYVKKEVFDGLDNDLFVYEVYLEVLAAQAQFEVIFNRPWGSEKYVALGD